MTAPTPPEADVQALALIVWRAEGDGFARIEWAQKIARAVLAAGYRLASEPGRLTQAEMDELLGGAALFGWSDEASALDHLRTSVESILAARLAEAEAKALYEARDALYRGEGPDLWADGDIVYGEWLGNRADVRAALVEGEAPATETVESCELANLQRWKAEAMQVLADWELVYQLLDRPGGVGVSKALASLAEIARLKREIRARG